MAVAKRQEKAASKATKTRVRDTPQHKSFKLSKKRLRQSQPLPGVIPLVKETTGLLFNNKKMFFGLALLYAVISFVFVQGFGSSFQIQELRNNFTELLGEDANQAGLTITLFGYLIGSASATASGAAGAYQLFLIIVASLAVIWAIRQILSGEKPQIRDALYRGMYPLIPFILILVVIALQLVPLLLGNLLLTTVFAGGLATTPIEYGVWLIMFALLTLLSVYMVVSSLFALYIVTLPDMRPMRALRSARDLVLHRRISIVLRLVALVAVFFVMTAVLFIPLILVVPQVVELIFLVAVGLGLLVTHMYVYLLYRSLL